MVFLQEESTKEAGPKEVGGSGMESLFRNKVKPFEQVVTTVLKLKKNYARTKGVMKKLFPTSPGQEGTPRLFLAALTLTLLGIALLSFFLIREFYKHQQTLLQLSQAVQVRSQLEQSLAQIRLEMTHQRKRIEKLGVELEKANAKAALIDQLRRDHETELARLQALYEGELADLRKLLETRENLMNRIQSHLESMRSTIQGGGYGLGFPDMGPLTKAPPDSPGAPWGVTQVPGHKRISGKVALVDRENRFIIITFGTVEGAAVGDFVKIYQGGAALEEGRIERVYPHLSAATIISEDTLARVQKGDSVFLALF